MTVATDSLALREAFRLLYHVPRSQVWERSRGGQRGLVHLHVKADEVFESGRIRRDAGQSLCGRRGWYERAPEFEGEKDMCPRCVEIGTRQGACVTEVAS